MTFPLLIAMLQPAALQWIASGLVGSAAATVLWWGIRVLKTEDIAQGAQWRYDVSRINELRRIDPLYRLFHPLIRALSVMNRAVFRESLPEIHREIQAAGLPRFWLAEEYLARMELLALMAAPWMAYLLVDMLGAPGWGLAAAAVPLTAWGLRRRLAARARARLKEIKRRLPFLLDLLTLLMEAGASFLNALGQSVDEFRGHPVAEEFGRVLADMNLGKTRTESFQAMRERLADDEIGSILGAIIQGENLGTPLARIFRSQADVMRVKRSQRGETMAGEAGVNMLLPGILVMVSTVLIILGPFLLNYLKFGLSL